MKMAEAYNRELSETASVARSPIDRRRTFLAMILSIAIPGLGQFYLRKPWEGLLYLVGVLSAGCLIYMNSYPVTSWHDLTRLESSPDSIVVCKLGDTKLMFHQMWQFKISGLIQGLIFWFYAFYDGWESHREAAGRRLKKKREASPEATRGRKGSDLASCPKPVKHVKAYCHATNNAQMDREV